MGSENIRYELCYKRETWGFIWQLWDFIYLEDKI